MFSLRCLRIFCNEVAEVIDLSNHFLNRYEKLTINTDSPVKIMIYYTYPYRSDYIKMSNPITGKTPKATIKKL